MKKRQTMVTALEPRERAQMQTERKLVFLLLENLRFHGEEKAGDEFFAGQLAESGDVYVNDAFGTAHRAHASTAVIAKFFPEDKAFGLLMQGEVEALNKVLSTPAKPLLAIIGGVAGGAEYRVHCVRGSDP